LYLVSLVIIETQINYPRKQRLAKEQIIFLLILLILSINYLLL